MGSGRNGTRLHTAAARQPADEVTIPPTFKDAAWLQRPRPAHTDGCNILFLDGHVKWMKTNTFYYGQSPVDRWFDLN